MELGLADADMPIATTVHDLQIIDDRLPQDLYDVPIDIIATPTRLIRVYSRGHRPSGIIWHMLSNEKLMSIPLLQELMDRSSKEEYYDE